MYREFGELLCQELDVPWIRAPLGLTNTTRFLRELGAAAGVDPEPFIEKEKHTTLKPVWDLYRSVTQDFFPTTTFAVVANETYTQGLRYFLEEDMGMPCALAVERTPGTKTDHASIREALGERPPTLLFGSYNERLYAAELGLRSRFIPASFPGAIVRRHTGTPFMGYSGVTYLVQEVCNALFDALFHILPLSTDMDRVEATPTPSSGRSIPWDDEARAYLDRVLEAVPPLVRISTAKRIRDLAEGRTREADEERVTEPRVREAFQAFQGQRAG
jgi:chlorophyllide a reductase subunit Z